MSQIKQIKRYGIAGALNSVFGYSVIFGLMWLSVSAPVANVIGYGLGLVTAFFLKRQWVFEAAHGHLPGQAVRFIVSFLISFAVNFGVLMMLLDLELNPYLSQILAGLCYTVTMFVLSRCFVFGQKEETVSK